MFHALCCSWGTEVTSASGQTLFEADGSSWWGTNAGAETCPSEGEEGRTAFISTSSKWKVANHSWTELPCHTITSSKQPVCHRWEKGREERRKKKKRLIYHSTVHGMLITVIQRGVNHKHKTQRCEPESHKWANYWGLQVLFRNTVYFMCLEELSCFVNKNEGIRKTNC